MKPIQQLLEDNQIAYTAIEPVEDETFAGLFNIKSVKGYRLRLPAMGRVVSIQCGVGTFTQLGRKGHFMKIRDFAFIEPLEPPDFLPANWYEVNANCEIATWLDDCVMQIIDGDVVRGDTSEVELIAFLKRIIELDKDAYATGDDLTALLAGVFD